MINTNGLQLGPSACRRSGGSRAWHHAQLAGMAAQNAPYPRGTLLEDFALVIGLDLSPCAARNVPAEAGRACTPASLPEGTPENAHVPGRRRVDLQRGGVTKPLK